jgi:hypothetical protein
MWAIIMGLMNSDSGLFPGHKSQPGTTFSRAMHDLEVLKMIDEVPEQA